MGLDYTNGCVNFRDVGAFVNLIIGKTILQEEKLYRGGSIDYVKEHAEIANVKSVISLRNGPDSKSFEVDYYHFPMSNKVEKYDTRQKEVRIWLNQIMAVFENNDLRLPVLIHCLSGKDRTGIVISTILLLLGMDEKFIIEEYLLSDGEVKPELIQMAIDGVEDTEKYFNRVKLEVVKANLKANFLSP